MNIKNQSKETQYIGTLCLYLASFLWGSAFIAQKILVDTGIPPFFMVGLRMSFTVILLFSIPIRSITVLTIKKGIVLGFIVFLVFSLQTYGLKTIDSSVSAFITSLHLVWTPIVSYLLCKSKISISNVMAIGMALVGIYFLNITENFVFQWNTGLFFTVLCSIAVSIQFIYAKYVLENEDPITLVVLQNLSCGFYAFVCAYFIEGFNQSLLEWTPRSILSISYLGLIASVVCFSLLLVGQKHIQNLVKITLIMAIQPLFTTVMAVFFLGEILSPFKVVGMFFIVLSVMIEEILFKKK